MTNQSVTLYTDDAVEAAILGVLRAAQDHAILVSPYNKFWSHLRDEIQIAQRRGVRVILIYRTGEDGPDIEWLGANGAMVYAVDRLHAKLFMNESTVIMTSMNLLETSSKNSKEVALQVTDPAAASELRAYVRNRLIPLGIKVHPAPAKSKAVQAWENISKAIAGAVNEQTPQRPRPTGRPLKRQVREARPAHGGGFCIRCAERIRFDPARPLCDKDFVIWNRYADRSYIEKCCHRCGKPNDTCYEKPLCYSCFKAVAR